MHVPSTPGLPQRTLPPSFWVMGLAFAWLGVCPGLGDGTFRRISAQTRWNRLISDASRSSVASSLSVGDEMYELWDSGE